MVTSRLVSDDFLTMTTKDVPATSVVAAKEMAAALMEEPPLSPPAVAMVTAPVVAMTTAKTPTLRGKLYELLKVAIATGVGLVLGAGVMYVYLRSYSNIGKEINAVAQSVNSLKGILFAT